MDKKKEKEAAQELIVDEKLFKGFNNQIFACVRDVCFDINKEIYDKYTKYCDNIEQDPNPDHEKFPTCKECWEKFLTKDLVKISVYFNFITKGIIK